MQTCLSFNRTSMELKLHQAGSQEPQTYTFNRTSMELKHNLYQRLACKVRLLIEPVWN